MELGLHFTELTCCEQTGRLVMSHEETMETAIAEYCPDMTRIVSVCGQLQIRERTALEGRVTATGHRAGHGVVYLGGERRPAQPDAAGAILLYGGGRDAGVVAAALGHRTVVVGRGTGRDGAEAVCPRAAGGDADRLHPRPVPVLQRHGGGPCSPRPAQGSRHQPAGYGGGTQLLRGAGDAGGVPRAGGPAAVPAPARGSPAAVWWAASWC